jgi:hypothetical protein
MAVTSDVVSGLNFEGSNKGLRIVDFAFDGAYPAGGEAITAAELQLSSIDDIMFHNKGLTDFMPVFQNATSKIALLVISTAVESGAGAAGAVVVRGWAIGEKEA